MPIVSTWTGARKELLTELWATGKTAEEIAAEMGGFDHTKDGGRCSVISKATSMGLPARRARKNDPAAALRARAARAAADAKRHAEARAKRSAAQTRPAAAEFTGSLDIPFGDLRMFRRTEPNECRFIADAGPDYLSCGNTTPAGRSYCDHHHAICNPAQRVAPASAQEQERRRAHGKMIGFANVRRQRLALFTEVVA